MPAVDVPPKLTAYRVIKLPIVIVGLVGVVLGGMIVVIASRVTSDSAALGFWHALTARSSRIDLSRPAVVHRIQQLQRLETVVYSMDKIVVGQREGKLLPAFLVGDRLLLLAEGQVVAGVDFSQLQLTDVSLDRKTIRVRLPAAEVFFTRLDSQNTRVYSRETGLLVPVDPTLETEVRQQAEQQLHDAALQDGILNTAQQNARTTLAGLLKGLGFEDVEFD
jgi:Protein of unknown function (DUF4230)